MIEIPDLAVGGLAAGTALAFVAGAGLWRSRRLRAGQAEEIAGLRSQLASARRTLDGVREELDGALADAERVADTYTAEVVHLAAQRIPAEATRAAHPHVRVPGPLHPEVAGSAFEDALDGALEGVLAAMAQERERVDAAARAVMRGATRDVQAGLYRLQDQLRSLQQRYDEPELAQTLFALDHENEQSLRRAQATAVVCGAWVGLAREESHLVEAVTGGQSRLVGYHRVKVNNHLEPGTALVSHAVEPTAVIVAELLDNALRHSAPDTDVVVNLERVHHGVTVTIDDAGVGMAADERGRAQALVGGTDPILLSELGDPPRMGLAAIGQLTRCFDLSVDLTSPSPYGGVRAVLLIRSNLLSSIDPAERPPAASTPRSTRAAGAADPGSGLVPAADAAAIGAEPVSGPEPVSDAEPAPVPAPRSDSAPGSDPAPGSVPAPAAVSAERAAANGGHARTADDTGDLAVPHHSGDDPGHPDQPDHSDQPDHPDQADRPVQPDHPDSQPAGSQPPAGSQQADDQGVLPQRRRKARAGKARKAAGSQPVTPLSARTPEQAAAALGALQSGTAAARSEAQTEGNEPR